MHSGGAVMAPVLVRVDDVPAQPWRNGGGRTRELLIRPAGERAWRLRISLAEVDRDGPFSAFPGIERWFSVIDGAGVRLALDGRVHALRPGHVPINFSGELPVSCSLIDGPTTDLNLMHAGGRAAMLPARSGLAWNSPLPQRGLFTRMPGQWRAAGMPAVLLPAHCLLWLDQAGADDWTFIADAASAIAPGVWLGFEP